MQTIGNTPLPSSSVPEQQNNSEPKKLTGFQNPEQRANINRNGRPPREWTWKQQLEDAVDEAMKDGKPIKYHMARAMVREVLKGNVQAFNAIMDRMDGKALQPHEIEHTGEVTLSFHSSLKQNGT